MSGWRDFYHVNEPGGSHHQARHITVLVPLHALESLSESQVAHDVVTQVVRPLGHVLRRRPLLRPYGVPFPGRAEIVTPDPHILQDGSLGRSERAVGEGVVEDPSSEGMFVLVDLAVRAEGARAGVDGSVPVGLLDVGPAGPIDVSQRADRVDREGVGADANDRSLGSEIRK